MKRFILFFLFIVFIIGNMFSMKALENSNDFKLNLFLSKSFASEEGQTLYLCITSSWSTEYETCGDNSNSTCDFYDVTCYINPMGSDTSDESCSTITCSDCATGETATTWDDC